MFKSFALRHFIVSSEDALLFSQTPLGLSTHYSYDKVIFLHMTCPT